MDTLQKTTRVAKKRTPEHRRLRGLMLNFNYFDEYDIIDSLGILCCQSLKILLLSFFFLFFQHVWSQHT